MPSLRSITPGKDRMIAKLNQNSWAAARDATSGTAASDTGDPITVRVAKNGSKYTVTRMFLAFDTSAIKEPPTTALLDIRVHGLTNGGTPIRVVRVAANATGDSDTAFAAADFDAFQGFATGSTMAGNVVTYSAEIASGSLSAGSHHRIRLNATARRDMAALTEFKIAIVGGKDYTNTAPTADNRTLIDSVDDSVASKRPRLKWVPARSSRKVRKTKGSRGRGFSLKNVTVTTGGKTVANGFEEI